MYNTVAKKGNAGYTLLEMLATVFIIAIVAGIGTFMYFKSIERMRTTEATTALNTAVLSQHRYRLKYEQFTTDWLKLDALPVGLKNPDSVNNLLTADHTTYYPRGGAQSSNPPPGYAFKFETGVNGRWFAVASRVGFGDYSYSLVRPFNDIVTYCVPTDMSDESSVDICTDYMGVETAAELLPDPRTHAADTGFFYEDKEGNN